jgi:hypothetical protein
VKYHSACKQHQVAPLCYIPTIKFLILLQTVYKKIYCEEFILGIILFLVALLQGILRENLELRDLSIDYDNASWAKVTELISFDWLL